MNRFLLLVAVLGCLSACRAPEAAPAAPAAPPAEGDCTVSAIAGITVTAVDSLSSTSLSASGRVEAHDGTYQEIATAFGGNPLRYYMAYERPGIYEVTVELSGYQRWTQSGVTVRSGRCHVVTVDLVARLVR